MSKLEDAFSAYVLSEESVVGGWEFMVNAYTQDCHGDIDLFKDACKLTEDGMKQQLNVTKAPGAWRSAKSTIIAAVGQGVKIVNDDGTPRSKGNVAKDTKGVREENEAPDAKLERYTKATKRIIKRTVPILGGVTDPRRNDWQHEVYTAVDEANQEAERAIADAIAQLTQ